MSHKIKCIKSNLTLNFLYVGWCMTWRDIPLWRKELSAPSRRPHHSLSSLWLRSPSLSFSLTFTYCRGWQGLIAQGCHSSILIIDPNTAQTIQVLERHKANVVKVSFLSERFLICFIVYLHSRAATNDYLNFLLLCLLFSQLDFKY